MDGKFLFNDSKKSLKNSKRSIGLVIENYNKKVSEKLCSNNKDEKMDVYRTLLVFMMKKAKTLEEMKPKEENMSLYLIFALIKQETMKNIVVKKL